MGRCPGTGHRWTLGTGHPICPVCHRTWRTLGVTSRPKVPGPATVPDHDGRSS